MASAGLPHKNWSKNMTYEQKFAEFERQNFRVPDFQSSNIASDTEQTFIIFGKSSTPEANFDGYAELESDP